MTNETTASQPKSIGDDAQFRILVREWRDVAPLASGSKAWAALVDYLDSRAPAAQASATIQAAPEDLDLLSAHAFVTPLCYRLYVSEIESYRRALQIADAIQVSPKNFVWPSPPPGRGQSHVLFDDGYEEGWAKAIDTVKSMFAATIQEPVMVAEVLENSVCILRHQDDGERWPVGTKLYAAPMVADPAGVESVRAEFESWCVRNNFSTNKWPDGVYLVSETVGAWEGWQAALAATVKAVPSEALDDEQAYEQSAYWHFMDFDKFKALRAEFQRAAPLADKTGGGE